MKRTNSVKCLVLHLNVLHCNIPRAVPAPRGAEGRGAAAAQRVCTGTVRCKACDFPRGNQAIRVQGRPYDCWKLLHFKVHVHKKLATEEKVNSKTYCGGRAVSIVQILKGTEVCLALSKNHQPSFLLRWTAENPFHLIRSMPVVGLAPIFYYLDFDRKNAVIESVVLLWKVTKMALRIVTPFSATVHNELIKFTKKKLCIQSCTNLSGSEHQGAFLLQLSAPLQFCSSDWILWGLFALRKGSCLFLKVSHLQNEARSLLDNQQTSRTLI